MINLTRYLASHYGAVGVRVNTISPGGICHPALNEPAEFLERYGNMTMLGRKAHAWQIGGAVVLLLSNAASYITGINSSVDGGSAAKLVIAERMLSPVKKGGAMDVYDKIADSEKVSCTVSS